MKRWIIVIAVIAVLAIFIARLTLVSAYIGGERITIGGAADQRIISFVRTRSALGSAEYERQLVVIESNMAKCRFELPIDGGAQGELVVAVSENEPSKYLFRDSSNEFLIDTKNCKAYKVMRSRTGEYVAQACEYRPGFPGNLDPLETNEMRERLIQRGVTTNELLINICEDDWRFIGVLGGPTGELQMRSDAQPDLPTYIKK